jgi:hypothetical protein
MMCLVVILLLNLLIAMMGDTYAKIAEIKNEWMRQVSIQELGRKGRHLGMETFVVFVRL